MFSHIASRLHGETNALYRLRDALINQSIPVRDLISGNINDQGFVFPQDRLEEILVRGSRQSKIYRPDSFGRIQAREAVSEFYNNRGVSLDPGNILLTPGTSLSYWYCFKILADEGDEILCPQPSYPLFDYIALLSGVRLVPYSLDETKNWTMDIDRLESLISNRSRAIVLISPHNPTGHVASPEEIAGLSEIALRHDLAIISDEVFSEFLIGRKVLPRPAGSEAPLICTLNGFSKMFALPGMKFGWMALSGEQNRVRQAMRALEIISDTFLPVNEVIQAASPEIFRQGESVRIDFALRIGECWNIAERYLESTGCCSYIKPGGGFYVTLHLDGLDEEKAAEYILNKNHILIHPGYFYDMKSSHLVLSFVQKPEILRDVLPALTTTLSDLRTRHPGNFNKDV
ncbi:MAG: pyridoxal phosphate-dependent aminotransferase [Acidobacteria bacterium]|nr:pyridoxal phosphate-dependent aminotransferase [Acidobacteriota bacterium]